MKPIILSGFLAAFTCCLPLVQAEEAPPSATAPTSLSEAPTAPPTPVAAAPAPERIVCDGLPYIDRGFAMVPLRPVCEFLKTEMTYQDGLVTLVKSFGEPNVVRTVTVRVGGRSAQVWDGGASRAVPLTNSAEERLGSVFFPAKFLVEILGGQLETNPSGVPVKVLDGQRAGVFSTNGMLSYGGGDAARVTITNRVGHPLSLRLTGPQKLRVEIGQGAKLYLQLKPGLYYYQAGCAGMQTLNGSRKLLAGRQTNWAWGK